MHFCESKSTGMADFADNPVFWSAKLFERADIDLYSA